MSNLKQSFDQVRAALGSLDAAMADALNAQSKMHKEAMIEQAKTKDALLKEVVSDWNAAARKTKAKHDAQIATLKEEAKRDLAELTEAFEAKINDQQRDYETQLAEAKEDLQKLEEKAADAFEIYDKYWSDQVGFLDTSHIGKRMLFEKLAERWEFLTNAEIEMLESVIDGKSVVL